MRPRVRRVPGRFAMCDGVLVRLGSPRQFVIDLIPANGKRGHGADHRYSGDGVENPGLRDEVTEQACREGGDDVTCVTDRLVAGDSPVEPFVSDEAQTDPCEGGLKNGPDQANQRLRRHHSGHAREPDRREAAHRNQQGCERHQLPLRTQAIDESARRRLRDHSGHWRSRRAPSRCWLSSSGERPAGKWRETARRRPLHQPERTPEDPAPVDFSGLAIRTRPSSAQPLWDALNTVVQESRRTRPIDSAAVADTPAPEGRIIWRPHANS